MPITAIDPLADSDFGLPVFTLQIRRVDKFRLANYTKGIKKIMLP